MKPMSLRKIALVATLLVTLLLLAGCAAPVSTVVSTATSSTAVTPTDTPQVATPTDTPQVATPTDTLQVATPTDTPQVATPTDTLQVVTPTATPKAVTLKVFDATELAKYNGQNGSSAYIAVEGKVYDVTDVPQWKGGSHFGRFQAGKDLTTEIETLSPHGVAKLDSVPIVGLYQP